MEPGKAIEQVVSRSLNGSGFRKSGRTWRAKRRETVLVFHAQRSQYGPQFYLNCGVYLRALGESAAPPVHVCHIRTRVESLAGESPKLTRALNFESSMPEAERCAVISSAIERFAIPWFEARASEGGVRAAIRASTNPRDLTMKVALKHLGVENAG